MRFRRRFRATFVLVAMVAVSLVSVPVRAHCDIEDGPVAVDAKAALAAGDVTPVLKWVRQADESEIRAAFARTLAVGGVGEAARELADTWFLETLVRVHRAGEGAPYTGIKPVGTPVGPAVRLADRALETGTADTLINALASHLADGLEERFRKAHQLHEHAGDSVAAGRAYVAAYVEFVHYAKRLHQAVTTSAHAHGEASVSAAGSSEHAD